VTSDSARAVRLVADALVRYPFEVWNFGDSVGFEGLIAAGELLETDRYSALAYGIGKGWSPRREPMKLLDQTIAGAALTTLAEREGDHALLASLRELAAFLRTRPRSAHGVFRHFDETPVADGSPDGEGPGVFVDCMDFDGPFFARLARVTGDRELADEAMRQLTGQIELLQDPATGLFHHFWLERIGRSNGIAWGRGQGWAMHGLLSALENLPADAPGRERLVAAVRVQADAMLPFQLEEGGWRNIVDDPAEHEETSVACFMAACFRFGIRQGILEARFAEPARRAWRRALDLVDDTGLVRGTSDGTPPGFFADHYHSIGRDVMVPWGQGPFLVAAREAQLT
jgi:unsaturated rhamnogalacturonyl hydrolase